MSFRLEKIEKKSEKCDIVRVEIIESITMPTSFVWAIDYYARLFPSSENVIPSNPIFEKEHLSWDQCRALRQNVSSISGKTLLGYIASI